ncbi:PREDICTED: putative F-box protein At4g09190 [Erythranthe guttata]|uniref:putative F-box protein At4g09190 n=1 Tax=Erythranthe guttata TaxID=4155 RepID=UPI00064E0638|nr:PREDICTED: putative F-box protein At4g09190 [Erythranthe guttata]|eukprot:XP_012856327.1 PREDICTED: putative F-box protein At4g09190 [Erythranthe guttata]
MLICYISMCLLCTIMQYAEEEKNYTNIDSLPDEMLFRILLELEPRELYESAMLVCRRWYKIIDTRNFIQEHLEHSRPGLLIVGSNYKCPTFVSVSAGRGGGKIDKFDYPHKFSSLYWLTCNGLAVEEYDHPSKRNGNTYNHFIKNHTTNKRFALPPFSGYDYYSCMGYAPASNEYKVVRLYPRNLESSILTLGVDKSWRYIDTTHISSEEVAKLLRYRPLVTEGFVHWVGWGRTCILSLNIQTEIITETRIPQERLRITIFLSTWRSVTMLRGSRSGLSWDVWEMTMKPNGKSGEWKKVPEIDLEAQKCRMEQHLECTLVPEGLYPVGWLNYMEVLVLCISENWSAGKDCVFYNVGTQEIQFFNLGCVRAAYIHKNSLVWFDHT